MAAPAIGQRRRWVPRIHARIDWSHPIAVGLQHCLLPVGGNQVIDLVTRRMCTPQVNAIGGSSGYGAGLVSGASGASGVYLPLISPLPYPLSFTWVGARTGTMDSGAGIFSVSFGDGVAAPGASEVNPYLYGMDNSSLKIRCNYANGSTYVAGSLSTADIPLGASTATLTIVSGSQQLWTDGSLNFTDTNSLADPAPGGAGLPFLAFQCYTQTSRVQNLIGHLGAVHGRILTSNEIAALAADPFCFLRS